MKKTLTILGCLLAISNAPAQSIAVNNFSFELPGTGTIKGWDNSGNDIPGWSTDFTPAGVDSGVESSWPGSTEGSYAGFLANFDPSTFNLTGHAIAAGEQFTLLVDARNNWSSAGLAVLRMNLYYDLGGVRTLAGSADWSLQDSWATYALVFDASSIPASVGNNIGIEIMNGLPTAGATVSSWMGVDNIRLTVAVPEPTATALLGLGVAGLALRKRRQN